MTSGRAPVARPVERRETPSRKLLARQSAGQRPAAVPRERRATALGSVRKRAAAIRAYLEAVARSLGLPVPAHARKRPAAGAATSAPAKRTRSTAAADDHCGRARSQAHAKGRPPAPGVPCSPASATAPCQHHLASVRAAYAMSAAFAPSVLITVPAETEPAHSGPKHLCAAAGGGTVERTPSETYRVTFRRPGRGVTREAASLFPVPAFPKSPEPPSDSPVLRTRVSADDTTADAVRVTVDLVVAGTRLSEVETRLHWLAEDDNDVILYTGPPGRYQTSEAYQSLCVTYAKLPPRRVFYVATRGLLADGQGWTPHNIQRLSPTKRVPEASDSSFFFPNRVSSVDCPTKRDPQRQWCCDCYETGGGRCPWF